MSDDELQLIPIEGHPPSDACRAFMIANLLDPSMPVFRAVVTPEFMARMKADRPDVANTVQLLVGPFGIVAPERQSAFRVAELQIGHSVVLNVEAEYDD